MKQNIRTLTGAAFLGFALITVNVTLAQTVVKETTITTNSAGTISEFGPETIVIRSEASPQPAKAKGKDKGKDEKKDGAKPDGALQ